MFQAALFCCWYDQFSSLPHPLSFLHPLTFIALFLTSLFFPALPYLLSRPSLFFIFDSLCGLHNSHIFFDLISLPLLVFVQLILFLFAVLPFQGLSSAESLSDHWRTQVSLCIYLQ
jgi:hypothetical protein